MKIQFSLLNQFMSIRCKAFWTNWNTMLVLLLFSMLIDNNTPVVYHILLCYFFQEFALRNIWWYSSFPVCCFSSSWSESWMCGIYFLIKCYQKHVILELVLRPKVSCFIFYVFIWSGKYKIDLYQIIYNSDSMCLEHNQTRTVWGV